MTQTLISKPTYVAYADETHYNIGRYRGVALVSMRYEQASSLSKSLQGIFQELGITEFKWHKLDSNTDRKAALEMLACAVNNACTGILRVDVLTWDIQDSRHRISKRDDIANLQRMYYKLFKDVLCVRWPDDSIWYLCPDEQGSMKWNEVQDFLGMKDTRVEARRDLFTQGRINVRNRREFGIEQIAEGQSQNEPLIQLADLFAGLVVYSRACYDRYEQWQRDYGQQQALFKGWMSSVKLSRSDYERCAVLANFNDMCKRRRLGVSLKRNRGLKTFDPTNPINFWWYVPQHDEDRAPVKEP